MDKPLIKINDSQGRSFKIFEDGTIQGLNHLTGFKGTVIINRIPLLIAQIEGNKTNGK